MKPEILGKNNNKLDISNIADFCFFCSDSDLNLKKGKKYTSVKKYWKSEHSNQKVKPGQKSARSTSCPLDDKNHGILENNTEKRLKPTPIERIRHDTTKRF